MKNYYVTKFNPHYHAEIKRGNQWKEWACIMAFAAGFFALAYFDQTARFLAGK